MGRCSTFEMSALGLKTMAILTPPMIECSFSAQSGSEMRAMMEMDLFADFQGGSFCPKTRHDKLRLKIPERNPEFICNLLIMVRHSSMTLGRCKPRAGRGGDPFWWGSPIYDADHIPLVLNATDERRTHERMARNLWLAKGTRGSNARRVCQIFFQPRRRVETFPILGRTHFSMKRLLESQAGGRRCSNAGVTQSSLKYASISFVLLCQSLAEPVSASFGSCPFCKGRKSRNNRQCSRRPSFRAGFTRELRREYDGSPTDSRA